MFHEFWTLFWEMIPQALVVKKVLININRVLNCDCAMSSLNSRKRTPLNRGHKRGAAVFTTRSETSGGRRKEIPCLPVHFYEHYSEPSLNCRISY
jgi:hypothetical protein